MVPIVIEPTSRGGEHCYDIYSRLLKDRIIFLDQEINDDTSASIIAQLLFLSISDPEADISLYIMSPGGDITGGMAIYDTMQHIPNDVATYCVGMAASMGAFLLSSGAAGKRYALPSSSIMIHQPWGGAGGTAKDIEIQSREINRLKSMIYDRMALHTGQPISRLEKDCEHDYYMSAIEAKEYGLVDSVIAYPEKKFPKKATYNQPHGQRRKTKDKR